MERRVLGKGLDALIPKTTSHIMSREFTYLPLGKVKPSLSQPRQKIAGVELEELSQSIKEKGFIQPIVVRKVGADSYEVVAGERRYQAANSLGLKEIPAIIREISDKEAFVLAIVENLQRKDLNPLEEASAFRKLVEEFDFSLEDVAKFVSKDKTTVVNTLRLLKLPPKIKKAVEEGLLSRTQARAILGMEDSKKQELLFEQILREGLSVREIEKKARVSSRRRQARDPFVLEVEERLQKALGTKIKIFNRRNNRGKIVIEYYTLKDLERIIKKIR
ncbi:MAG: ParB/RepB/Spo0J family partition protein [Candidatus Omnitrophica bacterium]|nr:ParB/RepB/Spo0J family partition protein [Candidatus Omnitrophota bacterium]MBU2043880.1 ParB/RepB/Spo0J family partition protein [Candidatus Omnitrophota bacterium]MBU2265824.1 ParB/RepB/Spo0J family partition protein [Candidatus Omnitrophota bacterium]MBU2473229.1 ParB/RepB/Spo0J family partition protein [Candidatus Omnitrophota bacterium]